MKRLRAYFDRIFPPYTHLPLLSVLCMNFIAYYIPKLVEKRELFLLSTRLDDALPLIPACIFIYVLAYVQWFVGYTVAARESRALSRRLALGDALAKLLAMGVMLLWPTYMVRPAVEVRGPATWLLQFIYRIDAPTHIFPSMHCLASWICLRRSQGLTRTPRWYGAVQAVFSVLVFISVLLVKQHVWPDVVGGIAAAELGIQLSDLLCRRRAKSSDRSARSHA